MRDAGARLMGRDRIGRDVFRRAAPEGLRVVRKASWDVSLYELIAAYGGIQARMRPAMHVVERRPVMTLDAAIERLEPLRSEERRVGKAGVMTCRSRGATYL